MISKFVKILTTSLVSVGGVTTAIVVPIELTNKHDKLTLDITDNNTILKDKGDKVFIYALKNGEEFDNPIWKNSGLPYGVRATVSQDMMTLEQTSDVWNQERFNVWIENQDGDASKTVPIVVTGETTTVNLSIVGDSVLSKAGDHVEIDATYTHKHGDSVWNGINPLPNNTVIVDKTDDKLYLRITKDVDIDSELYISLTNNDKTSDIKVVHFKRPDTTVSIQFINDSTNPLHLLSDVGSSVYIQSDVNYGVGATTWIYDTTFSGYITDGKIKAIERNNILQLVVLSNIGFTDDFHSISCRNNSVTSNSLSVDVRHIDNAGAVGIMYRCQSPLDSTPNTTDPDSIIYQNGQSVPGYRLIHAPSWKPGSISYSINWLDDSGVQIPNVDWNLVTINSTLIPNFSYSLDPASATYTISWPANAISNYDLPIVIHLNATYAPTVGDEIENQDIIINIWFGTIQGVRWTTPAPTARTGRQGSVKFSAEAYGQGQLDSSLYDLQWSITPTSAIPSSNFTANEVIGGLNNDDDTFSWNYTGPTDATVTYSVVASCVQEPSIGLHSTITITLLQTGGGHINCDSVIVGDHGYSGIYNNLSCVFDSTDPSANNDAVWAVSGSFPTGAIIISNSDVAHASNRAALSWTPALSDQDYTLTITAASISNPGVVATKVVKLHYRGIPSVTISGGGQTAGATAYATVNGANVDQGVNWSLSNIHWEGTISISCYLSGVTTTSCFVAVWAHGLGWAKIYWTLNATTIQNVNTASASVDGFYEINNIESNP